MTLRALHIKPLSTENVRNRLVSKASLESLLDRIQLISLERRSPCSEGIMSRPRRSRRCSDRSNTKRERFLDRWTVFASRSIPVPTIFEHWWTKDDRKRKCIRSSSAICGFDWKRFNCWHQRNWWPSWTYIELRIKRGEPKQRWLSMINRLWQILDNLVCFIAISPRVLIPSTGKISSTSVWWFSRTRISWNSNWMDITANAVIFWSRRRHSSVRPSLFVEASTILYSNGTLLARSMNDLPA